MLTPISVDSESSSVALHLFRRSVMHGCSKPMTPGLRVCVRVASRAPNGRLLPQVVQVVAQEQGGDVAADGRAVAVPTVSSWLEGLQPDIAARSTPLHFCFRPAVSNLLAGIQTQTNALLKEHNQVLASLMLAQNPNSGLDAPNMLQKPSMQSQSGAGLG